MNKRLFPITWRRTLILSIVVPFGLGTVSTVYLLRVHAQTVRKPFLAHTVVRHLQPDGTFSATVFITEATRSDGSWMTDTLAMVDARSTLPLREICLAPTRTITSYDPLTNTANSARISDFRYALMTSPIAADCLSAHPGPGAATCTPTSETVLGYPVWSLTREFVAGGDNIKIEESIAPTLDWKTLQFLSYRNGKLVEKRTVDAIAQGEPAPGYLSFLQA